MSKNHSHNASSILESATGPIRFNMTNDYLFKVVLQRNNHVLTGLISSLLHLSPEDVKSAIITNPIQPGDDINDKTVVLDVNVLFNNNTLIELEMQVVNHYNWVDRSTYYLCRNYANLQAGEDYSDVRASYHIGFLDYTLFPDDTSFYATYLLMNEITHKVYTDKLRLSVINLNQTASATDEDRRYKIDQWARLFKATTWEELKNMASNNSLLAEAGEVIYMVSADEHQRQIMEAREDAIRQERGMQRLLERTKKERDAAVAKCDAVTARCDAAYALLKKYGIDPNEAP